MKKLSALLNTPARAAIAVGMIMLVSELLIMIVIESISHTILKVEFLEKMAFEFIDPILLIILVSPALLLLIFKPMRAQQAVLERQLDELRRFHNFSIGRELRMKELVEENTALRHPLSVEPTGDIPVTSAPRDAADQYATTQPTEQNQLNVLLFMLEDLENAHKKIDQAHQEWIAALDVVDDPIFLHDKQFRILRCNKAYQQLAGIPFKQIIGQPYYEVFPKNHALLPCCLRAMEKKEAATGEEEMVVGDMTYRSRAYSIHDEQDAYLYSVHTLEDITERKQAEAAFRTLVGTAATNIGAAFFREATRSLSTWLGVECVIVGELKDGNRVRALAMQLDGKAVEHYEYALPGTPCNNVAHKGYCEYPEGVCQLFPADKDLVDMDAEAYVGTPIRDKNGKAIGVLCAISRHKLVPQPMLKGVFEIIAARAGTEIERKRAEDALIENEEKFRTLYESSLDAIMTATPDEGFLGGNPAAIAMFGCRDEQEFITLTPASVSPEFQPDGRKSADKAQEMMRLAMENGSHSFEGVHKRVDGSEFPADVLLMRTKIGGKSVIQATVRDITQRKQAEEKLRLRAQLLDSAADTIFMVDFNGNFVYLNEAAWKTRGYTQDEMMGINLHVLDTPKYEKLIESRMRNLMENGQCIFESEHRRKDGSVMPVEINAHIVESGGRKLVLSVIRDITERKQAEEALKESEEKYQSIYENTQVGLYRTRVSDGKLMMANDAMAKMFGFDSVEEATAKYITSEHYVDTETRGRLLGAIQKYGKFDNFEACLTRNDGIARWFQYSGRLVQNKGYIEGAATDITERKQAEAAIQHANRALAALSAVNKSLVRAGSEDELLQLICHVIVKQSSYRLAWVGYKQHDENKSIKIIASAGHDEGYLDAAQISWAETERGMGPSGRAIRSGNTQLCQDIANDPLFLPWRETALQRGYAACIVLPLINGEAFGVLAVYAGEVNAFTPAEIALLEEMAGDMAFGVRSLRMRQERDRALVKNQQHLVQLESNLEDTVRAIATIVEMRDPYTAGHQARVADLAAALAKQMGLPEEQVHAIHLAGTVHDLGKIKIPAEILSKPGRITDIEFSLIKVHPQAGYDILKGINFPWPIALMVLQHHERFDGSGYPQGLKGEAILLEARILGVADMVEAMSSHRPYRPGLGIEIALAEITRQRGIYFDPQVVDACLALFREQHYSFRI